MLVQVDYLRLYNPPRSSLRVSPDCPSRNDRHSHSTFYLTSVRANQKTSLRYNRYFYVISLVYHVSNKKKKNWKRECFHATKQKQEENNAYFVNYKILV